MECRKSRLRGDVHTNLMLWVGQLSNGWLASASRDQTIKIWNAESGECVNTLTGHTCQMCGTAERWVVGICVI